MWNCFINIDNWDGDEKKNNFYIRFFFSDTLVLFLLLLLFNWEKIKRYSTPMSIYTDSFRFMCLSFSFLINVFKWKRKRNQFSSGRNSIWIEKACRTLQVDIWTNNKRSWECVWSFSSVRCFSFIILLLLLTDKIVNQPMREK